MAATLFERLGGKEGIQRLVTDIVDNHYRNPLIRTRFEKVKDRAALERLSVEFLCAGSGGPQAYSGRGPGGGPPGHEHQRAGAHRGNRRHRRGDDQERT